MHLSGTLGPELSVHLGEMKAVFRQLRKKVFTSDTCPLSYKAVLVQMLLLADGLYNSSTWRALKAGEARRVHTAVMYMYRTILGVNNPMARHTSDDEVMETVPVFSPKSFIVFQRLSLFLRILAKKPGQLLLVLVHTGGSDGTWIRTVSDDMTKNSCQL